MLSIQLSGWNKLIHYMYRDIEWSIKNDGSQKI